MSYSELVKNLDHIRRYMRDFYVYGFKSREDFDDKSLRSYDDERRRLESWLGDYMGFRRTAEGKNAFISIDSREVRHNPLYNAWKAKSFTSGDITLHFVLTDILRDAKVPLSLTEITEKVDGDYLGLFDAPMLFDESTVRKKLKEYEGEGIVNIKKDGKRSVYSLNASCEGDVGREVLHFFSEVAPCGVIGSFLLDRSEYNKELFAFKHHYITSALDSEVMCQLFDAINHKVYVEIETVARTGNTPKTAKVVPLQIFASVQNGRQHLMAWNEEEKQIKSYRLDYITGVKALEACEKFDGLRAMLEDKKKHMWGVILRQDDRRLEHIEFTVFADEGEDYIYKRLMREKRCGSVERISKNKYRFSADVFDLNEMIPWLRTFICRIAELNMSNKQLEAKFKRDIGRMYRLYDIGGDGDAIQ